MKGLGGGRTMSATAVEDLRLELDISRAGVTSPYDRDKALPVDINVFVVGCGGNGGYVIPQVARYIRSFIDKQDIPPRAGQRARKKFGIELTLIDGDDVEQKNLIRQNFISPDIGKNKARTMGERYGRAFGLEVGIVDRYLNAEIAEKLIAQKKGSVVILGCVDNNATRKLIHESIIEPTEDGDMKATALFWIDVANEMFDGQVVTGFRHKRHVARKGYGSSRQPPKLRLPDFWDVDLVNMIDTQKRGLDLIRRGVHFPMPCFTDLYPGILDEEPDFDPDDPSCAENAAQVEQAMATNIMSSSQLFSAFCQVMSCLTDWRPEGEVPDNIERRPRAYLTNFGHGGRCATTFNTLRSLRSIFMQGIEEDDDTDEEGPPDL